MKNKFSNIALGCCAVFFCTASIFYAETDFTQNPIGTSSDSTSNGLSIDCSGRLANTKNKHINPKPLSIQVIDSCQRWHGWLSVKPTTQQEAKMQYDTLRHYIESCGKNYDTCAHLKIWETRDPQGNDSLRALMQYDSLKLFIEKCAASDPQSYFAFNHLDGAVQILSHDTSRFTTYRNWLISVLYLDNANPEYFCVCLGSIAGTYQVGKFAPLGYLAVLNYLRQTRHCGWDSSSSTLYSKDSTLDFQMGYDPTHLPSLDSMGLGFLLHQNSTSSPLSLSATDLASLTTNPNPFTTETTLDFTLNRIAYTTVSIYDVLGRWVWGDYAWLIA